MLCCGLKETCWIWFLVFNWVSPEPVRLLIFCWWILCISTSTITLADTSVWALLYLSVRKFVNILLQCARIRLSPSSIFFLLAGSSCLLSFFSGVLLGLQDKNAERKLNRNQNQTGERIKLSDVKHFGKSFWIITFAITFYYSAIFAFVALGK